MSTPVQDRTPTAREELRLVLGSTGPARRGWLRGGSRRALGLVGCTLVLALVAVASLAFGSRPMALGAVWDALVHYDPAVDDHVIVRELRIPRTILGLLVGAALGLAGALMQGVTRNPLADPGILGISEGASLLVVLGISMLGMQEAAEYVWLAFAGAALGAVLVYVLGALGRGRATPVKLTLAGAALSAVFASITTAILLSDVTTLDTFRFWAVGSLAGRDTDVLLEMAPFLCVGAVMALACGRSLNTLSLGDDVARSLGQRVGRARLFSTVAMVLLVGAATAAAGPIVFVGLTVPHVARGVTGPDYRWVLPYSAVLGGILLLGADVVGRVVVRPAELQVGIVTALIGAPFFVLLARRQRLTEL